METAINIGYGCLDNEVSFFMFVTNYFTHPRLGICSFACSLLRQGMKQIIITLETPEIQALERTGEKDMITKVNLYTAHDLFITCRMNI